MPTKKPGNEIRVESFHLCDAVKRMVIESGGTPGRQLIKYLCLLSTHPGGVNKAVLAEYGVTIKNAYVYYERHKALIEKIAPCTYIITPAGQAIVDRLHADYSARLSRPYRWGA